MRLYFSSLTLMRHPANKQTNKQEGIFYYSLLLQDFSRYLMLISKKPESCWLAMPAAYKGLPGLARAAAGAGGGRGAVTGAGARARRGSGRSGRPRRAGSGLATRAQPRDGGGRRAMLRAPPPPRPDWLLIRCAPLAPQPAEAAPARCGPAEVPTCAAAPPRAQTACAPRGAPALRPQEAPGSRGSAGRNAPGARLPLGSVPDALTAAPRCAPGSGGGDVFLKAPAVSLVAGKLDDETTSAWALPPPWSPGGAGSARCASPSLQSCRFEGRASRDCSGGGLGEHQAPRRPCSPDLAFLRSGRTQ